MGKARDAFRRAAGSSAVKRRPSGSEKRKRAHPRSIRFTPEEEQLIANREHATGLSFAALVRHGLFNTPPPRAIRHPPVEVKAAARVLAELGKIGSNVNQLAHYAHLGRFQSNSIDMALRDLAELRIACLKALGQEPDDPMDEAAESGSS